MVERHATVGSRDIIHKDVDIKVAAYPIETTNGLLIVLHGPNHLTRQQPHPVNRRNLLMLHVAVQRGLKILLNVELAVVVALATDKIKNVAPKINCQMK